MQYLELKRPVRSKRISQNFGDNKACLTVSTGKVTGTINGQCQGAAVHLYIYYGMLGHNGIDQPGILGEDVVHAATFDGWMMTESDAGGGLGVDVISNEPLFFEGPIPTGLATVVKAHTQNGKRGFLCHAKVRYWHLHAQVGHDRKSVRFGQLIGLLGSTGASSAPHLHWSWKFCDAEGVSFLKGNGYFGAYDPASPQFGVTYQHDIFAGDSATYLAEENQIPLSKDERADITLKLSIAKRALLMLRELLATL